jgi:hypothetical protein
MNDNEVREGLSFFTQQLRKAGILGQMPAAVSKDREPSLDPQSILTDGLAPMVKTVPQQDR